MPKDGKSTAAPRVRFPEFRGPWEHKRLEVVTDGISSGKDKIDPGGRFDLYGSTGVIGKTSSGTHSGEFILVARVGANAGLLTKATGRFGVTDNTLVIVLKNAKSADFIFNYLGSLNLNLLVFGSGQPLITGGQLKALSIYLPSVSEQQRIAECLTSLDEVIVSHGRKVEALKVHKQGLMRRLFPREGETLPRLRFPEFRKGPEWEQTSLGQIVEFQSGGTPSKANPAFWNGSIPWVSAKDMKRLFLDDTQDHISTAAVEDGAKQVPAGTVLMLTRGMTLLNDVPICILRRPMTFNQDVKALHASDVLDGHFLPFLLLANKERLLSMVDVAGHGTGKLNTDELKALDVMLPKRAEQKRIVACLTSLYAQITAASQKLAALKTHKQGLMQQLFPSPEEVVA